MEFTDWLLKKGECPSTIKKHKIRLNVIERNIPSWTKFEIDKFVVELIKKGLKKSTLNAYIFTIRLYAEYKNLNKILTEYKYYKVNNSVKSTFSDDEIESIINLPCPTGSEEEVWNKYSLLFEILAYTGCRPHEICMLQKHQIDWGKNVFIIEHTKTGVPRLVPIPPNLALKIKNYIDTIKGEYIFTTTKSEVFSYKSYYHNFKKRKELLHIDRPSISVYSFRHSYVTNLLEADVNIHKIAKLVGHSIEQTAHYEHLTTKDLHKAILKHSLVRKNNNPKNILKDIKDYVEGYDLEKDSRVRYSVTSFDDELKIDIKIRPI